MTKFTAILGGYVIPWKGKLSDLCCIKYALVPASNTRTYLMLLAPWKPNILAHEYQKVKITCRMDILGTLPRREEGSLALQ